MNIQSLHYTVIYVIRLCTMYVSTFTKLFLNIIIIIMLCVFTKKKNQKIFSMKRGKQSQPAEGHYFQFHTKFRQKSKTIHMYIVTSSFLRQIIIVIILWPLISGLMRFIVFCSVTMLCCCHIGQWMLLILAITSDM